MTKMLIGFVAIQTMLLALVALKVFSIEGDVAAARDASLDALTETAKLRAQTGAPRPAIQFADASSLTAEDIRQVVREEIANLPVQQVQTTTVSPAPRVVSEHELTAIRQRIDAFIARGAIESSEMTDLQTTIAQLPPDARREMFSRLTKAMNDGEIDGRF
ncbi:MAG: hypothetical protein AAF936_06220 [Pseudomonadota bacterium]